MCSWEVDPLKKSMDFSVLENSLPGLPVIPFVLFVHDRDSIYIIKVNMCLSGCFSRCFSGCFSGYFSGGFSGFF